MDKIYTEALMYSYHNRIKQRIKSGELIGIQEGSGEFAIVLLFSTPPYSRPIRPHALWRYEGILDFEKFMISRIDKE